MPDQVIQAGALLLSKLFHSVGQSIGELNIRSRRHQYPTSAPWPYGVEDPESMKQIEVDSS